MASSHIRNRDPLLDSSTRALVERRGKELLGLLLLSAALAFALLLGSYAPEDPGWMVATDEPPRNLLGRLGAAIASTMIIIGGLGAWGVPVVLGVWGLRFALHIGEERALNRVIFALIAVALASVYAATHVPGESWAHSFGLGGLFGDTVLGALIGMAPASAGAALKLVSLLFAGALLAMSAFVLGFSTEELRRIGRFILLGLIVSYAAVVWLAQRLGVTAGGAALALSGRVAERIAARKAALPASNGTETARREPRLGARKGTLDPDYGTPDPMGVGDYATSAGNAAPWLNEAPTVRQSLLSRVPGLLRRSPDPAPGPVAPVSAEQTIAHDDDRLRARISDVIRAKAVRAAVAPPATLPSAALRPEPPVFRPRKPVPLIANPIGPAPASFRAAAAALGAAAATTASGAAQAAQISEAHEPADVFDSGVDDMDDEAWDGEAASFRAQAENANTGARSDIGTGYDIRRSVVQHPTRKPAAPSRQAQEEAQPRLRLGDVSNVPIYETPQLNLLTNPADIVRHHLSDEALEENARMLENVLDDYGVKGEIVSVRPGPVVTMYELEPAPGLKASRVIGLADDIARSMSALSARVSTVPGRSVIGIELPNVHREKVVLREILSARDFGDSQMRLPLALGKDIGGEPIVANLSKMPHLLIAGTTGSGKSVAINTMILSLLYKLSPEECRLIMIDPKMLELSVYDGIPHLLSPVVTDPKKAVVALKWVVGEMEERYRKMSKMGVRNIEGYNGRVREALAKGELFKRTIQTGFDEATGDPVFETEEFAPELFPYIVVIVDEMADLMMVAGKEIEACIQRLAQMARASGIHLIMATQRPSVDVITGTIKANFPTRISFQVTSKIDSRTILGEMGAEQLLGMGDMLYMAGGGRISRIHGPFVSDEEVEEVVTHLKSFGPPAYMSGVVEGPDDDKADDIDLVLGLNGGENSDDTLYDQAVAIVARDRKCSTSYIQRKLGIGYQKAARLVEQMEDQGVVSTANHVGKREILLPE